jgi:hypothetical protein
MITLSNETGKKCDFSYRHLFVDRRSAGSTIWQKMTMEIRDFLVQDTGDNSEVRPKYSNTGSES